MDFKSFTYYLVLLVTIDATANLTLSVIHGSPSLIGLTSMIIRPIVIIGTYTLSASVISQFSISDKTTIVAWGAISSYLLISIAFYLIKGEPKNFIKTIIDIHNDWSLYSAIYLPFVISVVISIFLFKKIFKW